VVVGLWCCALGSAWWSPVSWAANFCVVTPEQFRAALSSASDNSESDVIRLREGISLFDQTGTGFRANLFDGQSLTISGGWSTDCSSRAAGRRSTISPQSDSAGLVLINESNSGAATVRVEFITFINGMSGTAAGGLTIQALQGAATLVVVENNVFVANENTGSGAGGLQVSVSGTVAVRGNQFSLNRGGQGAAQLSSNGATVRFSHNTLFNNDSTAAVPTGGVWFSGGSIHEVDNNLFWQNQQPDLRGVSGQTLRLRHNNYASLISPSLPAIEIGSRYVDPLFEGSNTAKLTEASPMINAGISNPPAGLPPESLDGLVRVQQGIPDIGAFEISQLLSNGFE
jgi:hypothetical protein